MVIRPRAARLASSELFAQVPDDGVARLVRPTGADLGQQAPADVREACLLFHGKATDLAGVRRDLLELLLVLVVGRLVALGVRRRHGLDAQPQGGEPTRGVDDLVTAEVAADDGDGQQGQNEQTSHVSSFPCGTDSISVNGDF